MQTGESIKSRIFKVIDDHRSRKPLNRIFHGILFTLIIISSLLLIVDTVKDYSKAHIHLFLTLEVITMVFFSVEYILRIYTCTEIHGFSKPVLGRLKYMVTPLMLIDLLSVVPFYLILYSHEYQGIYFFSAFRILRLLKAIRYVRAFRLIGEVFYMKRDQLLISFVLIIFIFVFASSVIYLAEREAQPSKFSDIPSAMWYTIVTITSVGYGDVYPITPLGKTMGGLISIMGLILFAIPTSILTSGFLKINESGTQKCPKCGADLD